MSTRKQSSDELIGTSIAGRYRILSKLAEGGMGVAYRAWNERAGIPVVIKIPKKILLEDASFIERFSREIRILQGLSHPNIVPILDVGEHDGLHYAAMRFLPGGSLSNRRLRDDSRKAVPMLPATLHSWLPQIAAALDYVHANGIVHRDVKPANIFFDAFSQAFLGDFGIAKSVQESEAFDKENTLTATNMGIGTQEYMPPEQFTPKAVIDGRADQYALAVMVYEMLAGTRPFTGATAHLIVEVTTKPVPLLGAKRSDLSSALTDAVHRALSKRPDARYSTCTEFADAVLRGVPPLEAEAGVARLLCPICSKILKLSIDAAGQRGKCPKCHAKMMIADDLGALWLLDEAKQQNRSNAPGSLASLGEGVPGGQELDDGLTDFRPVSDSSFKSRPKKHKSAFKNLPFVVGVGIPLLVIVFTVRNSLDVKHVPRVPTSASKKLELASDREQVDGIGKEKKNALATRHTQATPEAKVPALAGPARSYGIVPLAKQTPLAKSAFKEWFAVSTIPVHPEGHFAKAKVLVDGQPCDEYIFAHAPSRVDYALPLRAERFNATCVSPRGIPLGGHWTCAVEVDGARIFSQHLGDRELEISVQIPPNGKKLSLICDQEEDPIWDTAVWCFPRIEVGLPPDAVTFKDQAYWFSDDQKNHADAHKAALAMGGQLVVIDGEEENDFVAEHAKGRTWLGLRKAGRSWLHMSDDSKATFATWAKGQPSGFRGEVAASTAGNKAWADHFATDKLFYCVEWANSSLSSTRIPSAKRIEYRFDKATCGDNFVLHGNVSINAKHELECSGGKYSKAVTKERFAAPLRVICKVYALKDRPFDIFPAVLTDEQGVNGVSLHYGTYWNKRTILSVSGTNIEVPHASITPGKEYQIVFDVDERRTLTITRDGDIVYSAMLPADVRGEGHICLNGGIGHVAYTSVIIETR